MNKIIPGSGNINNVAKYQAMQKAKPKPAIDEKDKAAEKAPNVKGDQMTISMLMEESDKAYEDLRKIVEDLLLRQGYSTEDIKSLKAEDIEVDEKAREEAQKMIGPEGPYSPENVSDRIVDFAKAISHGDKSKLDELKGAIEQGFEAAEEVLGELPEISQQTHDLIMEKFDEWENAEE